MCPFRVGDEVLVLHAKQTPSLVGKKVKVTQIDYDGGVWVESSISHWTAPYKELQLLNKLSIVDGNKKSLMSKITTFVKNLTLSPDEKLMRKYGLKDDCGVVTLEGQDAILANFYNSKENQAYLLSIAQGLDAESEKSK